ncbi:MAG TPA: universal stress protein [Candidatus Binataceae bacterium]|nr:universal stress protein [Candidatus Binataceae bacterium]
MLNTHSILVPVDFDDHAGAALEFAKRVAIDSDGELRVLHAMPLFLVPGEPQSVVSGQMGEAQKALEKLAGEHLKGVNYQIEVRVGETVKEILAAARTHHSDLIVLPTHGRHGLSHAILGSVAERVVRDAPCPVLSFKPAQAGPVEARVTDVMLKAPETVASTLTLEQARQVMEDTGQRSLPVMEDEVLIGIITDRDLRSHPNKRDILVKHAMTKAPVCATPAMTVREAAQLLVRLKVGALPVVENGRLLGMLSTDEVIGKLVDRHN